MDSSSSLKRVRDDNDFEGIICLYLFIYIQYIFIMFANLISLSITVNKLINFLAQRRKLMRDKELIELAAKNDSLKLERQKELMEKAAKKDSRLSGNNFFVLHRLKLQYLKLLFKQKKLPSKKDLTNLSVTNQKEVTSLLILKNCAKTMSLEGILHEKKISFSCTERTLQFPIQYKSSTRNNNK
jgi:hypothetical protein